MPEQFLHGADVVSRFQQMRREAVAQTVARRRFGNGGEADGFLNRPLQP